MIIVDSCVWSLAFRRRKRDLNREERRAAYGLRDLLISGNAAIIGPVRQETLSGIATRSTFESVRQRLAAIDDTPVEAPTFILAAEFYNICREAGISPEAIDMTICAAAHIHNAPILTTDPDFPRYRMHLPITLFEP